MMAWGAHPHTGGWISTAGFLPWEPTVSQGESRCAEGGKVPGLLGMGFEEPQWSDK